MRVLIVAPEWPPNVVGGGGLVYERIASHLHQAGHDVTVAYGDFTNRRVSSSIGRISLDATFRLVSVPLLPAPKGMKWLLSATPPTPAAAIALFSDLRSQQFDVAHLHGVGFPLVDLASRIISKKNVPFVFTAHGVPQSPYKRGFIAAALLSAYLRVSYGTAARATAVTVVSKSLGRHAFFDGLRPATIYNGADLPSANYTPASKGQNRPVLRVCSLSRLSINKGIDVAISAVGKLLDRGIDVTYDVYGPDGGDEAQLKRMVDGLNLCRHVNFMGSFDHGSLSEVLSRYNVLLIPSRVEPFGIAAVEGLVHEIPVVASAVDGLNEILDPSCAILVGPGDADALANGLSSLMEQNTRARITEAGRERAKMFTWSNVLDRYTDALSMASAAAR